jgi:3-isopropylmalate dehydrogenase
LAQILSAAMMLRYSLDQERAADAIDQAVAATLEAGIYTKDIARDPSTAIGTAAMGDAIVARL